MMATRTDPKGASLLSGAATGTCGASVTCATMAPAVLPPVADEIARTLAALDLDAVRATYRAHNEFVYFERLFPDSVVVPMVEEAQRARARINRNYIPRHKKGGSVSYYTLREQAPSILTLYRSPAFLDFVRQATGAAGAVWRE